MIGTLSQNRAAFERAFPVWNEMTLWERFSSVATRCPQRNLMEIDGRGWTYGEAAGQADSLAGCLKRAGVGRGSHVALIMDNCAEFVFLTFALSRLGAVKVPLNTKLSVEEWGYMLAQSDAEVLIAFGAPGEKNDKLLRLCDVFSCAGSDPRFPRLREMILENYDLDPDSSCLTSWTSLLSSPAPALPDAPCGPDAARAPCDIIYTSGCTGRPKGVLLTHDMLWRSAFSSCLNRGFEFGRRIFIPLPLFHVYGYVEGLLAAILAEGTVILTEKRCTARHMLGLIEQSRAGDILSVPTLMLELLGELEREARKLPFLHAVYCSASTCPRWLWSAIRTQLGIEDVITGYGMTEVSGASVQTSPLDGTERLEQTVGRVLPGGCSGLAEYGGAQLQYKVVDIETGLDCPPGIPGELWCRGLTVTPGYYNDPAGNRALLDVGGWFHTGDIGCFDREGYLSLLGRNNDIYRINGENVSPKLIEGVIEESGQAAYAEVVGIPDLRLGEVGAAFVELTEDGNRDTLLRHCKENLAGFQVPRYFFFSSHETWPQTATGKVRKANLKALALSLLKEDSTQEAGHTDYVRL